LDAEEYIGVVWYNKKGRWAMGGGRGAPHAVGFPRRCCQQTN